MISKTLRVVHYVNQFFGQEGQEDKAGIGFMVKDGPVGPGIALEKALGDRGEVLATVVCGDNYFAENLKTAAREGIKLVADYQPDLVFAGPAFAAGRYGLGCGELCKVVQEDLGIPAVTGMFEENPAVELYRKHVYICRTGNNARSTVESLGRMVNLAFKLLSRKGNPQLVSMERRGKPEKDGYFPRGVPRAEYTEQTAAARAVDMVIA